MPELKTYLTLAKTGRQLEVRAGENLMNAIVAHGLPIASSCHGEGVCGKCRIKVLDGAANLSKETPLEEILRSKYQIEKNERISCQTDILGSMTIDTNYW